MGEVRAMGIHATARCVLDVLAGGGPMSAGEIAGRLRLNGDTIRYHLRGLQGRDMIAVVRGSARPAFYDITILGETSRVPPTRQEGALGHGQTDRH